MTSEDDQAKTITKDHFLELCEFSKAATQGKGRVSYLIELNYQIRHFLHLPPVNSSEELGGQGEVGELFKNNIVEMLRERGNDSFDVEAELNRCVDNP